MVYNWVGFSHCIDEPTSKTYLIGISAVNRFKVKVNGVTVILNDSNSSDGNYSKWRVYPITLNAGKNIIEMLAKNNQEEFAFACEIYDCSAATLSGLTSESQLVDYVIFSSKNKRSSMMFRQYYDIGDDAGYQCLDSSYSVDTCINPPMCTKIERTDANICQDSGLCSFSTDMVVVLNVNNLYTAKSDVFYTSTGSTDTPTDNDYLVGLQDAASKIGLVTTVDGDVVTFTNSGAGCSISEFTNKTLNVEVELTVTSNCPD